MKLFIDVLNRLYGEYYTFAVQRGTEKYSYGEVYNMRLIAQNKINNYIFTLCQSRVPINMEYLMRDLRIYGQQIEGMEIQFSKHAMLSILANQTLQNELMEGTFKGYDSNE